MFNNVLDRKETFFCEKNSIFQSPKQLKNENFFFIFFRSYFDRKQIKKKITFFNKKRGLTPLEKCGLGDFKRLQFLMTKKSFCLKHHFKSYFDRKQRQKNYIF